MRMHRSITPLLCFQIRCCPCELAVQILPRPSLARKNLSYAATSAPDVVPAPGMSQDHQAAVKKTTVISHSRLPTETAAAATAGGSSTRSCCGRCASWWPIHTLPTYALRCSAACCLLLPTAASAADAAQASALTDIVRHRSSCTALCPL